MPNVCHFEIAAEKPERAMRFYSLVFGWKFTQFDGMEYWMIATSEDKNVISGGLQKRNGKSPNPMDPPPVIGYSCVIDVHDVDVVCQAIVTNGGKVFKNKHAVPTVGWCAACYDTEGNEFQIIQFDRNAK